MPPVLSDTRPEAEAVQLDLLRQASPARRLALALSLGESVRALARGAIRRADPRLTEREVGLRFVSLHYGDELARAVSAELARRS